MKAEWRTLGIGLALPFSLATAASCPDPLLNRYRDQLILSRTYLQSRREVGALGSRGARILDQAWRRTELRQRIESHLELKGGSDGAYSALLASFRERVQEDPNPGLQALSIQAFVSAKSVQIQKLNASAEVRRELGAIAYEVALEALQRRLARVEKSCRDWR